MQHDASVEAVTSITDRKQKGRLEPPSRFVISAIGFRRVVASAARFCGYSPLVSGTLPSSGALGFMLVVKTASNSTGFDVKRTSQTEVFGASIGRNVRLRSRLREGRSTSATRHSISSAKWALPPLSRPRQSPSGQL